MTTMEDSNLQSYIQLSPLCHRRQSGSQENPSLRSRDQLSPMVPRDEHRRQENTNLRKRFHRFPLFHRLNHLVSSRINDQRRHQDSEAILDTVSVRSVLRKNTNLLIELGLPLPHHIFHCPQYHTSDQRRLQDLEHTKTQLDAESVQLVLRKNFLRVVEFRSPLPHHVVHCLHCRISDQRRRLMRSALEVCLVATTPTTAWLAIIHFIPSTVTLRPSHLLRHLAHSLQFRLLQFQLVPS